MGNAMSDEEEEQFLEEAYTMSLENPEADKFLNSGTAAPRCQPKHTQQTMAVGVPLTSEEVAALRGAGKNGDSSGDEARDPDDHKHRRGSPISDGESDEPRKKLHTNGSGSGGSAGDQRRQQESLSAQQQKKLSYYQMARLGYQELVNAIIRPPRADYKVGEFYIIFCENNRLGIAIPCTQQN
jgi:hypothetical protein